MKVFYIFAVICLFQCIANPVDPFKLLHGNGWGKFVKQPPLDPRTPKSPTYYHDSKIDNFDPGNSKTYKQRYWYSTQWYKPNGPQFLMIGGDVLYLQ